LRPVALSGLLGLSSREIDVAHRVAAGLSNSAIARELFLSEHTVRIHVSRVPHAFGVATRIGVATAIPASIDSLQGNPDRTPAPPLTTRQWQIVERIVGGATNLEIAEQLGIGVKTVEKHVSEILRRWGTTSRVGITRIALAESNRR
ncbi:MAG: LuxR C-terminal-related transcriptional regulator, partial [Terrimesophilobacter sp.]